MTRRCVKPEVVLVAVQPAGRWTMTATAACSTGKVSTEPSSPLTSAVGPCASMLLFCVAFGASSVPQYVNLPYLAVSVGDSPPNALIHDPLPLFSASACS